jgi:hypothetical protein
MKRIALGLAAVFLSAAGAQADPFSVAYGNTVTQTAPDGSKAVIYVNADKTWERHSADGKVYKGTYAWKDDTHACFTVTDPAPADASKATNCSEIKGDHKLGDTWTEPMGNGQNISVSITAGR